MRHSAQFVAFAVLFACSDDGPPLESPDVEVCLSRRDGQRYCIDAFEASRRDATIDSIGIDNASKPRSLKDRLPWTEITWAGAKSACESAGKRLCERDEWLDACDGQVGEDEGNVYTYGNELNAELCNTGGQKAEPTGARASCTSVVETFDQSGNVREWTGNNRAAAATRGGAWPSSQTHECKNGDRPPAFIMPEETSREVGFRCCRDG